MTEITNISQNYISLCATFLINCSLIPLATQYSSLHSSLPTLNYLHYVMTLRHLLLPPPPQYNQEETLFMTLLWLTLHLRPRLTSVEKHSIYISNFTLTRMYIYTEQLSAPVERFSLGQGL